MTRGPLAEAGRRIALWPGRPRGRLGGFRGIPGSGVRGDVGGQFGSTGTKRSSPDHDPTMRPTSILIAAAGLAGADAAQAQSRFLFSVDWQGPTVGTLDPSGTPITEGDIMTPTTASLPALGPLPTLSIVIPATAPVSRASASVTPAVHLRRRRRRVPRGGDAYFQPNLRPRRPGRVLRDEFAYGTGASSYFSVDTEFPVGNGGADAFTNQLPLPPAPVAPMPGMNSFMSDGDGMVSASGAMYPGVGLIVPNGPLSGLPDTGDNLDALDIVQPIGSFTGGRFFSLDGGWVDRSRASRTPVGPGERVLGGRRPDAWPGRPPIVYAPAMALGLDIAAGEDDLDALILRENGVPGFQASNALYRMGGGTDMLVFSVRRGSAVIGMPDSIFAS